MGEPKDKKELCIICLQKFENEDRSVSPQAYESWQTLLEAAKIRCHAPIIDVAKQLGTNEFPKIYYHRKCRSIFTMKRDLETLKRKANESLDDDAGCTSKRLCRRSKESTVYNEICIFCNKVKFEKGSRTREKLTQAAQLRVDKTLRECAVQKGDEKILAVTSRDIVAAEAHYHRSCYKNYTRVKTKEHEHEGKGENESDGDKLIEREAYANLFDYIRTDIIPSKKIVLISSLTTKLESFMLSGGNKLLPDSTRKHIRRRLECELGDSVQIFPDDKGKLLMVPDSASLQDVVLENQGLRRELGIWKAKVTNLNQIIDHISDQPSRRI